jgi:hypothetical protein
VGRRLRLAGACVCVGVWADDGHASVAIRKAPKTTAGVCV